MPGLGVFYRDEIESPGDLLVFESDESYLVAPAENVYGFAVNQMYLNELNSDNKKPLVDILDSLEILNDTSLEINGGDEPEGLVEFGGNESYNTDWETVAFLSVWSENDFEQDYCGKNKEDVIQKLGIEENVLEDRLIEPSDASRRDIEPPRDTVGFEFDGLTQRSNGSNMCHSLVYSNHEYGKTDLIVPTYPSGSLSRRRIKSFSRRNLEEGAYNPIAASQPGKYLDRSPELPDPDDFEKDDLISLALRKLPDDTEVFAYGFGNSFDIGAEIDGEYVDVPSHLLTADLGDIIGSIQVEEKLWSDMIKKGVQKMELVTEWKNEEYEEADRSVRGMFR